MLIPDSKSALEGKDERTTLFSDRTYNCVPIVRSMGVPTNPNNKTSGQPTTLKNVSENFSGYSRGIDKVKMF